ncbi:MAG: glycosyltransferase family 2 protein [Rhodopila sp.]|nr:glycosyltransferase family 2 protein [Rhodopila sp.]
MDVAEGDWVNTSALPAFGTRHAVLQVQSVLFNNTIEDVERAVVAMARAAELAITSGALSRVVLRYGDSGPLPALDEAGLARIRGATRGALAVEYDYFGANLGSARGHNRLADQAVEGTHFLWVQNPDVLVSPRLFETVLEPFDRAGVGQVEAKQLPIEHPKDYDASTGETAWATTACVMIPLSLFRSINGFDADTFFLYCDDVDLSFRIREVGFRVLFQPAAVCFHDKRLSPSGGWLPTGAEHFYSAEAGLMMAHKWSRPDLVDQILGYFTKSDDPVLRRAAGGFLSRRAAGTLPEPRDPNHTVAEFHGHLYAKHRFAL